MHSLRDQCAIVGVGASPQGKLPGSTALSLAVEAFKRALDDSGLRKDQIDGLLTMPGQTSPEGALNYLRLGETLGIDPRFTGSMNMGGYTAGALLQQAVLAINAGMATYVACVFGDAAATGGSRSIARRAGATRCRIWGFMSAARTARSLPRGTWRCMARPAASSARSPSRAASTRRSIPTR